MHTHTLILTAILATVGCGSSLELEGNPGLALVVVDAEITKGVVSPPIDGGAITDQGVSARVVEGIGWDELLIFPDVPAGVFAPSRLTSGPSVWNNWDTLSYRPRPSDLPESWRVTTEPGAIHYLGVLRLDDGAGASGIDQQLERIDEPGREASVWRRILLAAPNNPWAGAMQFRLGELE